MMIQITNLTTSELVINSLLANGSQETLAASAVISLSEANLVSGYASVLDSLVTAGVISYQKLAAVNTNLLQVSATPQWYLVGTVTYTNLAAAALTSSYTVATLGAGVVVHATKIKHTAAFTGGAIASYTISVGVGGGSVTAYAPAFNVFQAPGAAVLQLQSNVVEQSDSATSTVTANATTTTGNTNAATAGSAQVWMLLSEVIQ